MAVGAAGRERIPHTVKRLLEQDSATISSQENGEAFVALAIRILLTFQTVFSVSAHLIHLRMTPVGTQIAVGKMVTLIVYENFVRKWFLLVKL